MHLTFCSPSRPEGDSSQYRRRTCCIRFDLCKRSPFTPGRRDGVAAERRSLRGKRVHRISPAPVELALCGLLSLVRTQGSSRQVAPSPARGPPRDPSKIWERPRRIHRRYSVHSHQPMEAVAEATAWKDFFYASIRARGQTFCLPVGSVVVRVCLGEAEPSASYRQVPTSVCTTNLKHLFEVIIISCRPFPFFVIPIK